MDGAGAVTQRREDMRAADADRQFVADRLREALDEGRLDLGEYDDRLRQTFAARTYGELDTLLNDLPRVAPPEHSQVVPVSPTAPATPPARGPIAPWLSATWGTWFTVSAVCFVIWLLTGARGSVWPLWVAGPWGVVLLGTTLSRRRNGAPNEHTRQRAQRRQERRERRRYR